LSIPGFGPDISAKTLGAIGYPFRFDKASGAFPIFCKIVKSP